jgi:ATP-binding cassette subfamily B protein
MVLRHYNKYVDLDTLVNLSETKRTGTTLLGLSRAAEKLGLRSTGARVNFDTFKKAIASANNPFASKTKAKLS